MSSGWVSGPQERARVPWLGVRTPGASPCPVAGCQGPRSEPVSSGWVSGPQERARVPWLGVRTPGASPCPVAGCQGPRSEPVSRGRVSAVSPPVVRAEP